MTKSIDDSSEILKKLTIMTKLLYMQTRGKTEELKSIALKTSQQKKAYSALDGNRNIKEIAMFAGYKDNRTLETTLPDWESRGLILSIGKGPNKRYVNIENLEV